LGAAAVGGSTLGGLLLAMLPGLLVCGGMLSAEPVKLLPARVGALYLFDYVCPLFSGGGMTFTVQELATDLKRVGQSHIQKFSC
jgi:hypothetical protein